MGFGLGDAALSACAVYWISKKTGRHTVRLALTVAALMLMRKMRNRAAKRSLQKLGKKSGLKVLIVGTGFSGICAAIKMQEMGIEFVMLERHPNAIGGTWRDNTYPGCECDVKSALYSFSFAQNPNWSRRWAGQAEILEYMKNIVRDYDLEKHIRFGQEVSKLAWNEESKTWTATTNSSEEFIGNFVIAGCGQLRDPAAPPFPHSEYKGTTMHTAQWDHSVSFKGKNVACVGTGASAIQVVPRLAEEAASMTIYQRSPPWMVPKPDAANSWLKKTLFRHFSVLMSLTRAYEFCYGEVFYNIAISTYAK